jgi:hypothetical protein
LIAACAIGTEIIAVPVEPFHDSSSDAIPIGIANKPNIIVYDRY